MISYSILEKGLCKIAGDTIYHTNVIKYVFSTTHSKLHTKNITIHAPGSRNMTNFMATQ